MGNIGIIEAKYKSCAFLAIQCLKESGIADREDSFKHHIQNAKILGLMPDDFQVIRVTLADYGFVMQSGRLENAYFSDVVAAPGTSINTPSTVLITIRDYMHMGGYMVSLKTDGSHSFRLICPDPKLQNIGRETVTHVWIRWDDLIDRSPFPRKAVNRHTASSKRREVKDTDSFHFFNPNPCSNLIGDCVVRAFSGSMDISWSEAIDWLLSERQQSMHGSYTQRSWSRKVLPIINHSQEMAIDLRGEISVSRWTGGAGMVSVSSPTVAEVMPLPLSRLMVTTELLILGTAHHIQLGIFGSKLIRSQRQKLWPKKCCAIVLLSENS